jgi:valyl-tRNA synthetase
MSELDKTYDPGAIEKKWYAWWMERGLFHNEAGNGGTPYCIVIPPPNVTGILHMGHALNNTIQDVLIRWRRMQGRNAVWVPGTDHAGIATQNVVEKALRQEGRTRQDLGREAFVRRVWEWKAHYGSTIIRQLKTIGCSCDWSRERFTMDEGLSAAVQEVFIRLYEKGLVYRGHYIINWCPRCGTALSDEESEHREVRGKLYHLRYPLKDRPGEFLVVATTRPETLLGDVAVAVNPNDERHRALAGETPLLPVLGRPLKVVFDEFVDPKFGTGIVKVTPAHDPNDFDMGRRHGLEPVNVMDGDGTMNGEAGPYKGLDRFACRKKILADLEAQGLVEKIEDHVHAVGHCYRCDSVVEPRLSLQWFVRTQPLAQPALEAVRRGEIRFTPERWTKVYADWMENIRDWCISRQLWWGHRIPVFYCDACGHPWAARGTPAHCPACKSAKIRQDEDVLDTWFSSWLWPFSVFGWPEKSADLRFYYPTETLVTASEILFFWVARMTMAGFEFMGRKPFSDVYIHGTVRDDVGRKMSKSLGNSIDPLQIVEKYSADALRASLMLLTATGQDVYVSDEKFEIGRNFGTKVWNAARFLRSAAPPEGETTAWALPELDPAHLSPDDQHLLAKLDEAAAACAQNLERFRFNDYALAIYDFLWHTLCDWHLEYSKEILYGEDGPRRRQTLAILHHAFAASLRLLHPLMPFLTEELWHGMGYAGEFESIMTAPWPEPLGAEALAARGVRPDEVAYVEAKHELIRAARTLRADFEIPPKQAVDGVVKAASADAAARLERDRASIVSLARMGTLTIDAAFVPARAMPSALTPLGTFYLSIEGAIDVAAETEKLRGLIAKLDADIERSSKRLADPNFATRAKPEIVAQHEARRQEMVGKRAKLAHLLEMLAGS